MPNLVRHEMYVKSNVAGNNNKFWEIKIFDDFAAHVRNGRVGGKGQDQKPKQFDSAEEADAFAEKKIKEKISKRKGYVKFKGILGESAKVEAPQGSLTDIALKEIDSSSTEASKLIKYLSKKNIHNITSATTITYDVDDGLFKTPLGIVTQEGIDEARDLLSDLGDYVINKQHEDPQFIDYLQNYIQLIPRKVGRKLIAEEVLPDTASLQKESQLLDSLDASLQQVLTATPDDDSKDKKSAPKVFNLELEIVKSSKIIKHITDFYNQTRNNIHTSSGLRVKKVYSVNIKNMKNRFEKKGKKVGNIMELWHGSRTANLLSILKGGLVIPKGNESHVTGAMFSTGCYFSDQSTKSLNYSQGYWGGSTDNNPYMFLVDVAMGKYYVPSGPSRNLPKPGYDSTFAKAHRSGVMNNEMVIYDTAQCNLKYLIEFSGN